MATSMAHAGHASLNRTAFLATVHCLTGCAIGEILGMVLGITLGWGVVTTIVVSVSLAFVFGYALTLLPLLRSGFALRTALGLAVASDTISIALMEVIDNALMVIIPGAMDAGPLSLLFWGSMTGSLLLAGAAAYPLNRWLIARGRGHAVVHASMAGKPAEDRTPARHGGHDHHSGHHSMPGA